MGCGEESEGLPVKDTGEGSKMTANEAYERLLTAIIQDAPMRTVKRLYVKYVLARLGNNKVHTATKLGLDRRTIQR